ncbi:hypothetical protein FO440_07455 [Mucilaginibacter corticis]|uniref:Uncharacterized protein n=1 Tax=Mucilaginibacter corticis TaxID=2597670 RepID=A0A556MVV9_9SPHI|nr:hypothetical protein [Mucilaginibacter corticis]TSJ44002.1 hypothetical protein FO440_07455 [Mucilaginibacter corticis]
MYYNKIISGFLIGSFLVLTNSCSKVTWASFTTSKENIEYIPKLLDAYLQSPPLKNVRIFEYNKEKYMGLFIINKINLVNKRNLMPNSTVFMPDKEKFSKLVGGTTTRSKIGSYNLIQYTPSLGEEEIVTAHFIMEAVNNIRKNNLIEVYSNTTSSITNYFILYK